MVKELDSQGHFVSYAQSKFVALRQGIYLELSLNSNLPASDAGSPCKLAAIAFDDHVAHLIRPLLVYFKEEQTFDGIGFSTTVHLVGKSATGHLRSREILLSAFVVALLREIRSHRPATPGRWNRAKQWRTCGPRYANRGGRHQPLRAN